MLAFGSREAVATAYVTQSMRSSSHKFIRHLATITPLSIIGVHIIDGTGNLTAGRRGRVWDLVLKPGAPGSL